MKHSQTQVLWLTIPSYIQTPRWNLYLCKKVQVARFDLIESNMWGEAKRPIWTCRKHPMDSLRCVQNEGFNNLHSHRATNPIVTSVQNTMVWYVRQEWKRVKFLDTHNLRVLSNNIETSDKLCVISCQLSHRSTSSPTDHSAELHWTCGGFLYGLIHFEVRGHCFWASKFLRRHVWPNPCFSMPKRCKPLGSSWRIAR